MMYANRLNMAEISSAAWQCLGSRGNTNEGENREDQLHSDWPNSNLRGIVYVWRTGEIGLLFIVHGDKSMFRKTLATAVVLALGSFLFAAEFKSGPQSGETVPGPFHPLNINGDSAGKKACLYCQAGDDPT